MLFVGVGEERKKGKRVVWKEICCLQKQEKENSLWLSSFFPFLHALKKRKERRVSGGAEGEQILVAGMQWFVAK